MPARQDPVSEADDAGRAQAIELLTQARFGALAYIDPETQTPAISRVAVGLDDRGTPLTLISQLSAHFAGLRHQPLAALMVGEPGPRGDPLTHPRLMIRVDARFIDRSDPDYPALRDRWLRDHPKSKLYIDFADFGFVRLVPLSAFLNGGFGRALRLDPTDLLR